MITGRRCARSLACAVVVAGAVGACSGQAVPAAAVSEQEARAAVADVVATAALRSTAAMKVLCDTNDRCQGMSSSVRSDAGDAPGPDAAPVVLCVVAIPPPPSQAGSQLVVLEGTDGKSQHYVSQVLVDRSTDDDDVDGLEVQEPAFWLGTAYTALQHGRAWDSTAGDAAQRQQHDTRAGRPCTDTAAWLDEVAGSTSRAAR